MNHVSTSNYVHMLSYLKVCLVFNGTSTQDRSIYLKVRELEKYED